MSINEISSKTAPKKGGILEKFVMHGLEQSQETSKKVAANFHNDPILNEDTIRKYLIKKTGHGVSALTPTRDRGFPLVKAQLTDGTSADVWNEGGKLYGEW